MCIMVKNIAFVMWVMIMRCTIGGVLRTLPFTLCLSLLATNGWAADQSPPGQFDNGLISLTRLVPDFTRVSKYSGDIWQRNTMFGDLDGLRSDWYDKGFSLDMQVTQIYQKVSSGGSAAGNGDGAYNGLSEINAYLDTAKLGWWSGGLLTATVQTSWDNPLQSEVGNISLVNETALWPVPFHTTTRVIACGGVYLFLGAQDTKWTKNGLEPIDPDKPIPFNHSPHYYVKDGWRKSQPSQ